MRDLKMWCVGLALVLGVSEASGVPSPDVAPLFLQVRHGEVRSALHPDRTILRARGRLFYAPRNFLSEFSPETQGATVDCTTPLGALFHVDIPAGSAGWEGKGRKHRWRSAPGEDPSLRLDLNLAKGTFSCAGVSRTTSDLTSGLVTLTVSLGGDSGVDQRQWNPRSADRLTYRYLRLTSEAMEQLAIERLLAIRDAQIAMKMTGLIDGDDDLQGEYGTLSELSGAAGTRRGFVVLPFECIDFTGQRLPSTPLLPAEFADLLRSGFIAVDGYAYMLFLPDGSSPAGFTHETESARTPYMQGGSGCIGIDASESFWCAYAQPLKYGRTGLRRFFVNQAGVVLESANTVTMGAGAEDPIDGSAAFLGTGITSATAMGTRGNDGDLWKAVE